MAKNSNRKKQSQDIVQSEKNLSLFLGAIHWKLLLGVAIITLAGFWIFWPVLHGDWLWDDDALITENAVIHNPAGLWEIWSNPGSLIDYQPLKASVVWLQWQLWHTDTLGYHLTNIILHIIGALLVWRFLSKLGLRWAWLGGLLFVVHPTAVESVAWISELKNTLSLPPFLLAMCAYIDYEEHKRRRDYFMAVGLFLTAMLCKTTMVMFPLVILLYVWWKRGQINSNDLKSSMPFLAISLALGLITVWFLKHHAIGEEKIPLGDFFSRLACAGLLISFYFTQCFWPIGLLPLYSKWKVDPPSILQFLPWLILAAVVYWLWTKRETWGRHALLGLGFFFTNLIPFLGFNAASYMSFTWAMDHLLYIPIIGLIGLVTAGLGQIGEQIPGSIRPFGAGIVMAAMGLLAWESRSYAKMYINEETLWTYTIEHNPETWPAHNRLGNVMMHTNRTSEAIRQFKQVIRLKPDYAPAFFDLGIIKMIQGDPDEALSSLQHFCHFALQNVNTDYAHLWIWILRTKQNQKIDAKEELLNSLSKGWNEKPESWGSKNAAFLLDQINENNYLSVAASTDPDRDRSQHCEAWYYAGMKRLLTGDKATAADYFRKCLATQETDFVEYDLAQAELRTLGISP